jgi:hypothetical protein
LLLGYAGKLASRRLDLVVVSASAAPTRLLCGERQCVRFEGGCDEGDSGDRLRLRPNFVGHKPEPGNRRQKQGMRQYRTERAAGWRRNPVLGPRVAKRECSRRQSWLWDDAAAHFANGE